MKANKKVAPGAPSPLVKFNQMFADAGWTPSEQNFQARAYVIDHGSFYTVAGFPPGLSCRSKACKTEAEILEFLKQEAGDALPANDRPAESAGLDRHSARDDADGGNSDGGDSSLDDALFNPTDDISEKQAFEAALAQKAEELAIANARIAELEARAPEIRTVEVEKIVERVVEVSSPEAAPLRIIPEEIAAMMEEGETFTHDVRRKLTERLNVELAELKNLRGLAGEDLKREAEIEKLLGLFARLGEI